MHALGDLLEQCGGNFFVRGVLLQVDRDEQLLRLCVDIANVDTALVGEKNPVALIEMTIISDLSHFK